MHNLTISANDDAQGTLDLMFVMGPTGASDTRGSLSTHGVICWGGHDIVAGRLGQGVAELTFPDHDFDEDEDNENEHEEHDSYHANNISIMFKNDDSITLGEHVFL